MIHRKPDGSPYDPSGFNVKQFEEQYGPGGVPEGWTAPGSAISPLQNPNAILVLTGLMALFSGFVIFLAIATLNAGNIKIFTYCIALTCFIWSFCVWGFIISQRRRKWLKEKFAAEK